MTNLSTFPGVDPTGARDTTAAIQAALASFGGRQTDLFVDGTYMVNPTGLRLPAGVSLYSNRAGAGVFRATKAAYNSALLTGIRCSSFYVGGIAFDYSPAIEAAQTAVLAFVNCADFEIEDCRIDGQFVFGIAATSISAARLRRNRITLTEARPAQNEAILITASGQSTNVKVEDNTCVNSAMDLCMADSDVTGNLVTGFKFGAGITTEDYANLCHHLSIRNNRMIGGIGADINNTVVEGIENWAPFSRISGNKASGNAGAGIVTCVANCIISENDCEGNGGSGLATALERGSNSQFLGNQSFGNGRYGYEDFNALLGGIVLVGNNFAPNHLGALSLYGKAYVEYGNRTV